MEMISYAPISYAPMLEQEEELPEANWEKSTIKYVINNKSRVLNSIRSSVRNVYRSQLQTTDIEDIYSEIIFYLHKCSDYDIERAMESSEKNGSQIVSLEGYVNTCIKYCVKRYISTMYNREKEIIADSIRSEEGEVRLLDMVPDKTSEIMYEDICYDASSALKSLESKRYKYGIDIYMILYVRYITLGKQPETRYRQILDILEVSRKELSELERKISYDEDILNTVKALSLKEAESAVVEIRPYVYSAFLIDKAINIM